MKTAEQILAEVERRIADLAYETEESALWLRRATAQYKHDKEWYGDKADAVEVTAARREYNSNTASLKEWETFRDWIVSDSNAPANGEAIEDMAVAGEGYF